MELRPRVPAPAEGWTIEADLRSAHGARLSGDFLVTSHLDPARLGLVLVDVSGRGPVAGARAQRLAAAFGPLLDASLGSGRPFMPAANRHVGLEFERVGDDESFATAVQLTLDLHTGAYTVTGAGHPPAVLYQSLPRQAAGAEPVASGPALPGPASPGATLSQAAVSGAAVSEPAWPGWAWPWRARQWRAGAWRVLDDPDQGPALGLLGEAAYPSRPGRLGPGDALLLYTDGLVESRRLDVDRGIDRLVRRAAAVLPHHRTGAATRIASAIRAEDGDDRALVVIRRHA